MGNNNQSPGCTTIILIFIAILVVFGIASSIENKNDNISTSQTLKKSNVKSFTLTKCLGKKLAKNATLNIPLNGDKWSLNFNNGDIIYYTLISLNENDPLCDIKTIDNYGDNCNICISREGDEAIVKLRYDDKTIIYSGYAN